MNNCRRRRSLLIACAIAWSQMIPGPSPVAAQSVAAMPVSLNPAVTRYLDQQAGVTVDHAVVYALEHNGELLAMRKEIDAAAALVKQAGLRANPQLEIAVAKTVTGTDNNITVEGMLPLELGGRRPARIRLAERELDLRRQAAAERERILAADVRNKFGESLAAIAKLGFDEDLITASQRNLNLVAARVVDGGTAPLEENQVLVELNRLRSAREISEGNTQIRLLELRNLLGMTPEEPIRLRGTLKLQLDPLMPLAEATAQALAARPDLNLARAMESFAEARIGQARAEGRLDAGLVAGFQRMDSGFPFRGVNDAGQLGSIRSTFNYLTVGVSLALPVRNKNQGAIEAAAADADAATRRREFLELTVRREVAAAYAQYQSAARAAEIFRAGVSGQANINLDVVRQTYELGSKTLIDYLAEQKRFIDLQNGYIDVLLETYKARVEFARATASTAF